MASRVREQADVVIVGALPHPRHRGAGEARRAAHEEIERVGRDSLAAWRAVDVDVLGEEIERREHDSRRVRSFHQLLKALDHAARALERDVRLRDAVLRQQLAQYESESGGERIHG